MYFSFDRSPVVRGTEINRVKIINKQHKTENTNKRNGNGNAKNKIQKKQGCLVWHKQKHNNLKLIKMVIIMW